ncbi:MAG: hypothetical protein AAGE65_08380 [Planctomycetota bacterium]
MYGPASNPNNVGCLRRLLQLLGGGASAPGSDGPWPYRRKKYLLSKAELNFYRVLLPIVTERGWTDCLKVNLNDLRYLAKGTLPKWDNRPNRMTEQDEPPPESTPMLSAAVRLR